MSAYLDLTREFNAGRTRAILTSGHGPSRNVLPLPVRSCAASALGRERLEAELDLERRAMIRAHEERLERYAAAASRWREAWPSVEREIDRWPLDRAHARVVERALGVLPFEAAGGRP
jgi:hypothetical protein